jgi:transglutaminase-like putative cysteine protease
MPGTFAMDLHKLLSVHIAALVALGGLMSAMGQRNAWPAVLLITGAMASVAVTDVAGWFRLGRNAAAVAALVILLLFVRSGFRLDGEARLLALADLLVYLQLILLFQKKDRRIFWWLAVMSLLQVILAARFSQGVGFGLLLVIYMLIALTAMTLLVLYQGQPEAARRRLRPRRAGQSPRTDLGGKPAFTSSQAASGRAGVVRELFARLGVMGAGILVLAGVIFFTVPRLGQPAWRGAVLGARELVGFSDKITLGELGEILESRDEVMRIQLRDKATGQLAAAPSELYLRGAVVTEYAKGQWFRGRPGPAPSRPENPRPRPKSQNLRPKTQDPSPLAPVAAAVGLPLVVRQRITMEPLDRDELFSIWPIVRPVRDKRVEFHPETERLLRSRTAWQDLRGQRFSCEVETTGLAGGEQPRLTPCEQPVDIDVLTVMPKLPRLEALADAWLAERPALGRRRAQAALWLERKFTADDRFQYSLQGQPRDLAIDPIEDFVSNHPRGHCEYFATALAMMLRSQGIPSRVVLGFRTDEWNSVGKFYQVRQLHAHAWVEAYLPPRELPKGLMEGEGRQRWVSGGWLRLDPTPAAELGTAAADRSTWGQWQRRFHGLQAAWDDYVVEMDRQRQRDAVFGPLRRSIQTAAMRLADPRWWRDLAGQIAGWLRLAAWPSLSGWLLGVGLPLVLGLLLLGAGAWGLVRLVRRLWRRLAAPADPAARRGPIRVEFYRRFEGLLARRGLVRPATQTPRQFARAAGVRLAQHTGRGELAALPLAVVDAFYQVRFGGRPLDKSQTEAVEHALAELQS